MIVTEQSGAEVRPRNHADERAALIEAYAEYGMGVPPEFHQTQAQKHNETGDNNSVGEIPPQKEMEIQMHEQTQTNGVPNVNPNPSQGFSQIAERKLGLRALERAVDAGVCGLAVVATATAVMYISKKLS